MIIIPYDKELRPGTWAGGRKFRVPGPLGEGQRTALFCCPNGHIGTLSDHDIAADGIVSPSVVCPGRENGCAFHDWIKLEGWDPEEPGTKAVG